MNSYHWGNNELSPADTTGFGFEKSDYPVWREPENCEYVSEAQRALDVSHKVGLYYVTDVEAPAP